jgi:hypothetical protein
VSGRATLWGLSALTALTTALPACGSGTPGSRGYGSREVLPIRDSTFLFSDPGPQTIGYTIYVDGGTRQGTIDLSGPDAGQPLVDAGADADATLGSDPCGSVGQVNQTLTLTDPQTGQQTILDGVVEVLGCSSAGPTIVLLRIDASGALTLWSGPFAAVQQIPLSIVITDALYVKGVATAVVLGALPAQPDAVGLFAIDLGTFAVTELVPPTLGAAAWASGATPAAGTLSSLSLLSVPDALWGLVSPLGAQFSYERSMADGSTIMFAGTFPSGPASELALFAVAPSAIVDPTSFAARSGAAIATEEWQVKDSAGPQVTLFVWDDGHQQLISCPLPGPTDEVAVSTLDGTKILYGAIVGPTAGLKSPLALVTLPTGTAGDAGACTILAPTNVGAAGFSGDSSSVFWLIQPETGDATLWTAAADGTGARVIGQGAITQPRYTSGTELEFELGGDLVWVDTADRSNALHYIGEKIFGTAIDLQGPWVVIGHDFSTQDGTGTLSLVDRDGGAKHLISADVVLYEEIPAPVPGDGLLVNSAADSGVPRRWQIAYMVRGRNPSPQDGVWVATINQADLH